jgi:heme oxygenase
MSVLRSGTHEKHMAVEKLPMVQYLLKGNISEADYVVYLFEMLAIYQTLESLAQKAGLFDTLPGIARSERIAQDLAELSPQYCGTLCRSTHSYINYLSELYNSSRRSELFAHVYVRHLGDMYGGKMISRVVPGSGRWYEFPNRAELLPNFNALLSLDLTNEALVAFDHYGNIFNELWDRIHTT